MIGSRRSIRMLIASIELKVFFFVFFFNFVLSFTKKQKNTWDLEKANIFKSEANRRAHIHKRIHSFEDVIIKNKNVDETYGISAILISWYF